MHTKLQPGRYVVAVSGGVDSIALLHMLVKQAAEVSAPEEKIRLIVAHYDHGIRSDSSADRRLVEQVAKTYKLPFVFDEGNLGANTSEAAARKARYAFLHRVREESKAHAVVTAHHEDDVIETAILNHVRGTNRRGMTSLRSTDIVKRPLLHVSKKQLIEYAQANGLVWREDSTNTDLRYKRNVIRHTVLADLAPHERKRFLAQLRRLQSLNTKIEAELANHLHMQPSNDALDRRHVCMLPHAVSVELLAAWLRKSGLSDYDRRSLLRLIVAIKTYGPGRRIDINKNYYIDVNSRSLALVCRDR